MQKMRTFLCRHFDEFLGDEHTAAVLTNFNPELLDHYGANGPLVREEAAKATMDAAHLKWPDLQARVLEVIAESNKVLVRYQWTFTDAASDKRCEFIGFVIWRFARGRIVERWATLSNPEESH